MKRLLIVPLTLLLGGIALLAASFSPVEPGERYRPFFMTRADLENSVFYKEGKQELLNPGKIYVYGNYIFINERYKGVHIIDNSNPAAPDRKAFIIAPGCIDIAVKENIIYMDNAVDLVAFDLNTNKVTKRITNMFPEHHSPNGSSYYSQRPENMILVGWNKY